MNIKGTHTCTVASRRKLSMPHMDTVIATVTVRDMLTGGQGRGRCCIWTPRQRSGLMLIHTIHIRIRTLMVTRTRIPSVSTRSMTIIMATTKDTRTHIRTVTITTMDPAQARAMARMLMSGHGYCLL